MFLIIGVRTDFFLHRHLSFLLCQKGVPLWFPHVPLTSEFLKICLIFPVSLGLYLSLQTDPLKHFMNLNFLALSPYQKTTTQNHHSPSMKIDWENFIYCLIFLPMIKWHFSTLLSGLCISFWKCSHEIAHIFKLAVIGRSYLP